jgi:[NiFe] hydrogenase assembly HybE family chaperone
MKQPVPIADRVEEAFTHIWRTRMNDVPILNERLSVAAVGFRSHNLGGHGAWVGALVTPWFINLLAIAEDGDQDGVSRGAGVTQTVEHHFPAGTFPFLVCEEAALGRFAMCSLFSPVHEFEDQTAALAVAEAALAELFDGEGTPAPTQEEAAMATMWREGHWVAPADGEADQPAASALKDDPAPSRRAIITAGLAAGEAGE